MKNITAIIVEDELKSRDTLRNLLRRFCPEVEVVGEAQDVQEACTLIENQKPGVVFLDIELPREDGFKLFNYFSTPDFEVIFTTAYDQYAVRAFRLAAVDYLLKPIAVQQLKEAVRKLQKKTAKPRNNQHLQLLLDGYPQDFPKIALPTTDGYSFVELNHIIFCQASRSYTYFHLQGDQKILVSRPLKSFEDLLLPYRFFRINRSYIINLKYIEKYSRTHQGEVTLSNGEILSVSEQKRAAFLSHILGK